MVAGLRYWVVAASCPATGAGWGRELDTGPRLPGRLPAVLAARPEPVHAGSCLCSPPAGRLPSAQTRPGAGGRTVTYHAPRLAPSPTAPPSPRPQRRLGGAAWLFHPADPSAAGRFAPPPREAVADPRPHQRRACPLSAPLLSRLFPVIRSHRPTQPAVYSPRRHPPSPAEHTLSKGGVPEVLASFLETRSVQGERLPGTPASPTRGPGFPSRLCLRPQPPASGTLGGSR